MFYATHAGILTSVGRKLSFRSAPFSFLLQNAPLPLYPKVEFAASVYGFSPVTFSAQNH
jgi:hypothetical protein